LWRLQIFLLVGLVIWPVSYGITRALVLFLLLSICANALIIFWRIKWIRWTCFSLAAIVSLALSLPGRKADDFSLRKRYVTELKKYEGTKYIWGGENRLGIDCSGLIRCAWIDSNLKEGVRTGNPALLRESIALWWFDSSARALRDEYRQKTKLLVNAPNLAGFDHSAILPGDFAVTSDGVHTLAYLGEGKWIEADPGVKKVIEIEATGGNGWMDVPVCIIRWQQLESQ
jgi:hypothetical protein